MIKINGAKNGNIKRIGQVIKEIIINDLACCGNCKNITNKYFSSDLAVYKAFQKDFEKCYPGQNFYFACNTVLCKKGHYPKHVDNVCKDWEWNGQKKENNLID